MSRNLLKEYDIYGHLESLKKKCRQGGCKGNPLSVRGEELPLEQSIARYLPNYKDDEDYQAIKAFQSALNDAEKEQHDQAIAKIRELLAEVPNQDLACQGIALREAGLQVKEVLTIIGRNYVWFSKWCRPYIVKPEEHVDVVAVAIELKEKIATFERERGVKVC